ncbi:MAG: hypothetical protein A2Y63_03280 [Candidatus Riflebacteria bacterium RBG_13_59_9]|nr:MAG: hypothetical protein A2Y63_03280 [Candidatus Riflebacteria bacterium RBG_13_59_9]
MSEPLDLSEVRTYPLRERKNLVSTELFGSVLSPHGEFAAFLDSLPDILRARDLKEVCSRIVAATAASREIVLASGAHQIKLGMAPYVMRLIEEGLVTAVAMNGAAAVHDSEIAMIGATSEDVAESIQDGSFGMARETGEFLNAAIAEGARTGEGLGAAVGRKIAEDKLPHRQLSLLHFCHTKDVQATVHVAYGTDVVHMHPSADGALTGKATEIDFRKLAAVVCRLEGGVMLNVGSAVVLPEVFLKCLSIARNLGHEVSGFTAVNLDMIQHYRPQENVLRRPTLPRGRGFALTGNLEILFPLITHCLLDLKARAIPKK